MAYIRRFGSNPLSDLSVMKEPLEEALAFCGGALATLKVDISGSGSTVHIYIYDGESRTSENTLVEFWSTGNNGFITGAANSTVAVQAPFGLYARIVATKSGLAIISGADAAVGQCGLVLSLDNDDNPVSVVTAGTYSSAMTFETPTVVPRDDAYTAAVVYAATANTTFGCTSLAKVPVPSYDGSAKYLPGLCFAHSTQYRVDGSVTLNNVKYYSIGGVLFLRDTEE